MAHEAVVSLNLIIERFLYLNLSFYSRYRNGYFWNRFLLPILERAEVVHEEVWSLKSILELDHFNESESLNALKEGILEAVPKFKDLLEDQINKCQLLFSQSQSLDEVLEKYPLLFSDLEKDRKVVRKEMISFVEMMKKINKEYNTKLDQETSNKESPLADEDFGGNAKDLVGVYDEDLDQLIYKLLIGESSRLKIIQVVGMAGIGKTTIVKALYDDPVISDYFDTRAFVKVGPDYHLKDILVDLVVCLFPNYNKILVMEKDEQELKELIHVFIHFRRYLIVFDDVWDMNFWGDMKRYIPEDYNGSRIIFTTRLSNLTFYNSTYGDVHEVCIRNEEESWSLFCRKVFLEDSCPPGLEKVGKKIVRKCEGLPLGIISIANILSKAEKSLEYWEHVAKNENLLALATKEGSHMSEKLLLSYKHLPPHLKECCLYFGVFPLNHEISVSKIVKLWVGEGLVQPKHFQTIEDTAREYLEVLVSHNIVLVRQQSSSGRTKTCSAHYFFWHLLVREATNKKIFHLIKSYPSAFSDDIHCQRRLCIHMNALLGLKRVSESIQSVSNVRSFLCTGPEHQYPVSISLGLTSIKVLDALTIRLYKFPEILEQVELKYLAFTYDGKLPSSISRLKNIEYLIIHRYHLTIINSSPSYMPIEIWDMQELRHLQVMGSDLPHPVDGAQLPKLLTLLGVSDRSCTKEVLQSIQNLQKLGVRIILPQSVFETLHIFDHLALLSRLKSFKCTVSNPNPKSQQVFLLPESIFLSSLTKSTLGGCGFAWKHMSMIGALNNLRVLKLRSYAFEGPDWVVDDGAFPELQYLLLEDTNLVHWRVGYYCFPQLICLSIRHCYKLEEIPHEFRNSVNLQLIEVVDCCPSALASAKHIMETHWGYHELQIMVYSSFTSTLKRLTTWRV